MANPFKKFYESKIRILSITEQGVYEKKRTQTELGTVYADVQPYSGGLAEAEYGYSDSCVYRMFCDNDDIIKAGNYAEYNGKIFRMTYVSAGKLGAEVLLNEYIV